ncbi:MAG: hypothetical protein WAV09_03455 [Minisyncoccia bacterium]
MSATQKATGKLIAFHVPREIDEQLTAAARRYGFESAALYVRAVALRSLKSTEEDVAFKRIGELRARIQKNVMRVVMQNVETMTAEELLGEDE